MAVDGVDDAVALAYNAWPERLYVLEPDGTIHYKGGLGPMGFKPREAAAALAQLLGTEAHSLDADLDPPPPEDCEDDGFSGLWKGEGAGRVSRGESMPIRFTLALGTDGTVGGRAEVSAGRMPIPLLDAAYDRESGKLSAAASMQGQRWIIEATVNEGAMKGSFQGPDGTALFAFEVERAQIGFPLVPGTEKPAGTWRGTATARDPAQSGKTVVLELTEAMPERVAGTVEIAGKRATIRRGHYIPKTGTLGFVARSEEGSRWRVSATVRGTTATGTAMMGAVALVVHFTIELESESPEDEG